MQGLRIALLGSVLTACASTDRTALDEAARTVRSGEPIAYEVRIDDNLDEALHAFLLAASEAEAGRDTPPSSMLALRRRANDDAERLTRALHSEGYYDATVEAIVTPPVPARDDAPAEPAMLVFDVAAGERYRFAERRIEVVDPPADYAPPTPEALGLEAGEPARAEVVYEALAALERNALEAGHAYAALGEDTIVIDRERRSMDVTLRIAPGPLVTLQAPSFAGIEDIDEAFLRGYIAWQEGERFHPNVVRDTRRDLVSTRLFRTVRVSLPDAPPETADPVPVTITGEQRLHRTVGITGRFETDSGPGINAFWEHRNLLGAAERLRAELDVDPTEQLLDARFRKPDVLGRDSALIAETRFARQDTDAFESLEVGASAGLEYRFGPNLTGTTALRLALSEITDTKGTETFGLVSVPSIIRHDDTDSPLDPSRGYRLRLEATPFWDVLDTSLVFQRLRLDGSTYLRLRESPRIVLAVRGAVGSLFGAARDSIPANERFYSGGGGSVRGVPFQTAGPLDANDDPLGGRSLVEFSTELRYAVTESIGVVGFVDGGAAGDSALPDFGEGLQFGAGLGLRYGTPIGPLRFDVAVPVDRRPVDDAFQVYISLGQAF